MKIEFLNEYTPLINDRLYEFIEKMDAPQKLKEAMLYSISAGGKRLRPCLMMQFYKVLGYNPKEILDFACAVEMIHTYSLIHDDLPCMDDDDMRRGKPSCHIAFGEDIALLAGDAMLTAAFEIASENTDTANAVKCINLLAKAAGMCGMCAGQCLDLQSENRQISADELKEIHKGKTVAMIKICAQVACAMANVSQDVTLKFEKYCDNIGLAFQIRDDVLDKIGDEELLGKPINSDCENNKNTYVSFYGLEKCNEYVDTLTSGAIDAVSDFDDGSLSELAEYLAKRKH